MDCYDTILGFILGLVSSLIAFVCSSMSKYKTLNNELELRCLMFYNYYRIGDTENAKNQLNQIINCYIERTSIFHLKTRTVDKNKRQLVDCLVNYARRGNLDQEVSKVLNIPISISENNDHVVVPE